MCFFWQKKKNSSGLCSYNFNRELTLKLTFLNNLHINSRPTFLSQINQHTFEQCLAVEFLLEILSSYNNLNPLAHLNRYAFVCDNHRNTLPQS